MEDTLEKIRNSLCKEWHLNLKKSGDDTGIFEEIDSFVELSRGNTSVELVRLFPYDEDAGTYEVWDKVGQGVGNLKSLYRLNIRLDNEEGNEPDWEILARILRHVSRAIELNIFHGYIAGTEDMRAFATAIQGHPAITSVTTCDSFRFESTDMFCSALATLPNLQTVFLRHLPLEREEVPTLGRPESMTELLRVPSLRSVVFCDFSFTDALCEATANALKEGSAVTYLNLDRCSFPTGGREKIASALKRNTRLNTFKIRSVSINEAFCDAMAAALLSNATLQELIVLNTGRCNPIGVWVASLFLALGMNKTLKSLVIFGFDFAGELCPALQDGLEKNSTLQRIELQNVNLATADVTELYFSLGVIKAVQSNKTVKTLKTPYLCCFESPEMTDDEVKNLTSLVKQNYGLESLPNFGSGERMGDLRAILRLNAAGRRYLKDDGSSIVKGVDVLSGVSRHLDCIFLHLLENPSLCNRDTQ
jgi:hypothetical protein